MKSKTILISTPQKGVCQITLNRPEKRNALNPELIEQWTAALQHCAQDDSVRLVVITGNGEHFCAGGDLAAMKKIALSSHEENVADALQLAALLKKIYRFPKPTLALVQGAVMGGGLGIIAACDMVVAAENSAYCFSETKIGLTPSVISPYVIPVIGARAAKYYFLTAEKFSAQDAMKMNLVQKIVPTERLNTDGYALAAQLLKNSPHALTEAKKLIRHVNKKGLSDALIQFTAEHLAMMRASHDAQEGFQAFLDKRAPIWK